MVCLENIKIGNHIFAIREKTLYTRRALHNAFGKDGFQWLMIVLSNKCVTIEVFMKFFASKDDRVSHALFEHNSVQTCPMLSSQMQWVPKAVNTLL